MITTDILLLSVLGGIALLAYMIAINAHGPVRLSLSYLVATLILAGTVYVTVQYVNGGETQKQLQEVKRLEMEKQKAEEQLATQQQAFSADKEHSSYAGKLNAIITKGAGMASSMASMQLQDASAELSSLIARSADMVQKCKALKDEADDLRGFDKSFTEAINLIKEAIQLTNEAAYYYKLYYYSEDSSQEDVRARVMRQKAQAAYDKFQKASTAVTAGG